MFLESYKTRLKRHTELTSPLMTHKEKDISTRKNSVLIQKYIFSIVFVAKQSAHQSQSPKSLNRAPYVTVRLQGSDRYLGRETETRSHPGLQKVLLLLQLLRGTAPKPIMKMMYQQLHLHPRPQNKTINHFDFYSNFKAIWTTFILQDFRLAVCVFIAVLFLSNAHNKHSTNLHKFSESEFLYQQIQSRLND